MGPLGRAASRHGLFASAVVLAIALAAGAIRLLPWLLSREVPLRVAWPFAQALAAVAVETAFFVGLPVGFALAAAQLVERGEARALLALGASPARITLGALAHALLLGALAFAGAVGFDADASVPGRFARQLVEQGRASCAGAREPRTALVPLVDVTWLCFPGAPPRVVGTLPGFGERAWFSATQLEPSDDLRSLSLEDLRIVTRKSGATPELRLHVARARVSGLAPWGRPSKIAVAPRAGLLVATALALALLSVWVVVRRSRDSRVAALLFGGAPALAALSALHAIDKGPLPAPAYALVVGAALAALALAVLLEAVASRLMRRRRELR